MGALKEVSTNIKTLLLAESTVTAIIGQKVYHGFTTADPPDLPFVTFHFVGRQRPTTHDENIRTRRKADNLRVRVSAWSSSGDQVLDLADAIDTALQTRTATSIAVILYDDIDTEIQRTPSGILYGMHTDYMVRLLPN